MAGSAVVLMAVSGSVAALAGASTATATSVTSAQRELTYTMRLSATSATVQPGAATTTVISFDAPRRLYGYRVDLSASGLPAGVTASFSPRRPLVSGHSTLTLTSASSAPAGASTITAGAIVNLFSSDPIGTSTTFDLTINTP
jgi:hypothetical protein